LLKELTLSQQKKQLKHNALEAKRKSGKGVGIRLTLNAIKDKNL
jgi:hypothetical protein